MRVGKTTVISVKAVAGLLDALDTAKHERIFGCPVRFACATNAMVTEGEFLDRRVPSADPRLYPILKDYLDEIVRAMPREAGFLCAIRRTVADSMRDGDCRLACVAKRLALSQRTLQRKLKEYDTDFQAVLDDTRYRFACEYLRDPRNTVTEVAFLLGYSEVSARRLSAERWFSILNDYLLLAASTPESRAAPEWVKRRTLPRA